MGPLRGRGYGGAFVHHVVLALALDEVDPWDAVVAGESVHRQGERVGDR